MRIVFMGTPLFAEVSLRRLLQENWTVCAVFTQPDRPSGRGKRMAISPVKQLAEEHGIPVYQPTKIRKESVALLQSLHADVFVTAAFGQILSQAILDIPPMGTVNVHASLLPRHRGSAPIQYAILQGDTLTGVTTMLTEAGIDTGDMLRKCETPIGATETAPELTARLANMGADLLIETLRAMEGGTQTRTPQPEAGMTYDPMLKKESGCVDWSQSAEQIQRMTRALVPWPGTYVDAASGALKLLRVTPVNFSSEHAPGTIVACDRKQGLFVKTMDGAIRVDVLQAPGGKPMIATDYLLGHPLKLLSRLEDM